MHYGIVGLPWSILLCNFRFPIISPSYQALALLRSTWCLAVTISFPHSSLGFKHRLLVVTHSLVLGPHLFSFQLFELGNYYFLLCCENYSIVVYRVSLIHLVPSSRCRPLVTSMTIFVNRTLSWVAFICSFRGRFVITRISFIQRSQGLPRHRIPPPSPIPNIVVYIMG